MDGLRCKQGCEVFLRPPTTSWSEEFKELHSLPHGLLTSSSAGPGGVNIAKIAGWIEAEILEEAQTAASFGPLGLRRGNEGYPSSPSAAKEVAVFRAKPGEESHWSAVVLLEPGSKVRLEGPSHFRLRLGRAQGGPKTVLTGPPRVCCQEDQFDLESAAEAEWLEVTCCPQSKGLAEARIEALGPAKDGRNGTWGPLLQKNFLTPETWPLVQKSGRHWVDSQGLPCEPPPAHRAHPRELRQQASGQGCLKVSLLVVMAAWPAQSGVGALTPNWNLLAAMEEALYRRLGTRYELHVALISEESQLASVDVASVQAALSGAQVKGAAYFLSPQQVKGAYKPKTYLVHDVALFGLMQQLEEAGISTVWPHPSHLYKLLAGKEWPPQLCLSPAYHVPLTTRVPRNAVLVDSRRAAREASNALAALRASEQATSSHGERYVVKVGFSWKSEGVIKCNDLEDVAVALQRSAAVGEHSSFMVQELVEGVICEAMVYFVGGHIVGRPQHNVAFRCLSCASTFCSLWTLAA